MRDTSGWGTTQRLGRLPRIRCPRASGIEGWWPDFRLCGFASSTADIIPDARLLGTVDYRLYLVAGPTETIHLYEVDAPGCG